MVSISVLSLTMLVSACIGGDSESEGGLKPLSQDEQPTIKVMYYYDESEFFRDYGTLFVSKFPNINVEVLNMQSLENSGSLTDDDIYKFIEEKKPDVLLLETNQYEKLAGEGKLYDLDPLISQDKFDLEGINSAIVKLLRNKGGGNLYGLTPTFNSQALIYNVDLFQEFGIEPPTDSMSWDEVFALANRFPTNGGDQNRVYGFGLPNYSDYADLAYTIGLSNELGMVNANSKVTLDGDSWKNVFQMVVNEVNSKAIHLPSSDNLIQNAQDYYSQDPFISKKVAMKLVNSFEIENLKEAKVFLGAENMPNWGIVTAPVNPSKRSQSSYFSISNVFSVNADSPNLRAAWEFVQFINSDGFAQAKAKTPNTGGLLSRTAYISDVDGVSMEPLFQLEPASNYTDPLEKAPASFQNLIMPILQRELQAVIDNKKTMDEAISEMQNRAQEALVQAP